VISPASEQGGRRAAPRYAGYAGIKRTSLPASLGYGTLRSLLLYLPQFCLAAGDCMPARVAPVSLWTDTGAVRCVTKAFSACQNQRTNNCAPHGALLTYVTLSVRVFPLGGNTRVTRRVCYHWVLPSLRITVKNGSRLKKWVRLFWLLPSLRITVRSGEDPSGASKHAGWRVLPCFAHASEAGSSFV
jgi:hypothetical protein